MKTELIEGWREVRIGEISHVDTGQGAPQGNNWFTGDKIFVRAGDLNRLSDGTFVGDYCEKITDDAVKKYGLRLYPKNCVVFPKSGMSILTENMAILKHDSYVVNHLAILEFEELTDAKYVLYQLRKLKIRSLIKNLSYPSIRMSDVKNFKISWPTKKMREHIVSVLEKADRARELRKEADELTKTFLKSVFVEMFGNLSRHPSKAEVKRLGDLCTIKTGGTPDRTVPSYWNGGNIPWVKTGEVKEDVILETEEFITNDGMSNSNATIFPKNSIIIAMYGEGATRGRVAKLGIDAATNQACAVLLPTTKFNTDYLLAFLRLSYDKIRGMGRGGNQSNLNLSMIREFEVILPEIELQDEFAAIVKQVDQLKTSQGNSKKNLDDLFNLLIQESFRGESAC